MRKLSWFSGLIPAGFTPMHDDGSLNLDQVPAVVEHLLHDGVDGLFVCGSTGEGVSLTREERQAVAEAYVKAAAGRLPVIVHVGHNSLAEAKTLAAHAQSIGAAAIAAVSPNYFKPLSIEVVVECMAQIAEAAPDLPFYYYHIPGTTGIDLDMVDFLHLAGQRLPTLAGMKYSKTTVYELQTCVQLDGGRFNVLFGSDEMLLSGLCGGAHGAVGSTYNFAAPLYRRIIQAFEAGNLKTAQHYQGLAAQMVRTVYHRHGHPGLKAMMKIIGVDCGPPRLPQVGLCPEEVAALRSELEAIGFFEWGRG